MESEEVKEIKEKLQEEIFIANSFGDKLRKVPTKELEKILALINELESENERLKIVVDIANERSYCKKFIEEWRKEYQKELDKQGKGYIAGSPDFDLVYKLYFDQKDRITELENEVKDRKAEVLHLQEYGKKLIMETELKQFAEKLKNKLFEFFQDNEGLDGKISVGVLYVDVIGVDAKDGTIISLGLIDRLLKDYEKWSSIRD